MKKVFYIIFGLIFCIPFIVCASTCNVISGDGTNIGDEIACGDEHFYVLDNSNGKIKMLSKYNLYVGDKIIKGSDYFDSYHKANEYCDTLIGTYGEDNVVVTSKYGDEDKYFCRLYIPLEYDSIKQSKDARGLYPDGNMEVAYPIYGAVYLGEDSLEINVDEFDDNYDLIPDKSKFKDYFEGYKDTLNKMGVNVLDIGFIKRSGIQDLLDTISDSDIVIPKQITEEIFEGESEWDFDDYYDYDMTFVKINIKDYIPEKYKWIYSTSYWIGSGTLIFEDVNPVTYYDEFLTTVGDYCAYDRGCYVSKIGVGLRPVVTISEDEISDYEYKFIKGDNQELTIEDIKEFTFTIDGDYSLFESLKVDKLDLVKDEDYKVTEGSTIITFTEAGIKKLNTLSKGEYEIIVKYSNNKEVKGKVFIDNVINPFTGDNIIVSIIICVLSIMILYVIELIYKKKRLV